jgi:hypothetical protein
MALQDNAKELLDLAKNLDLTKAEDRNKFLERTKKVLTRHSTEKTVQSKEISKRTLSPLQKAYREYFNKMLELYGVDSPAKIKDNVKKKQFFTNISKQWKAGIGPKQYWETKVKKTLTENINHNSNKSLKLESYIETRIQELIK